MSLSPSREAEIPERILEKEVKSASLEAEMSKMFFEQGFAVYRDLRKGGKEG